jgi:flagella basal body P-ring formation protein FlgA
VVDLPTAGLSASCIVRFELRTETETVGTWQTAVQTRIWRDVLVARSPLSRGMLASHADIGTERRDVLTNRDALVALPGAAETLEITGNVSAGSTLTARSLRFRPVVNRGKVVDAVVQNGSLQISMRVEVLEDGLPGQTIRVRNPKTKREFRGTVQNEQTIYVSL